MQINYKPITPSIRQTMPQVAFKGQEESREVYKKPVPQQGHSTAEIDNLIVKSIALGVCSVIALSGMITTEFAKLSKNNLELALPRQEQVDQQNNPNEDKSFETVVVESEIETADNVRKLGRLATAAGAIGIMASANMIDKQRNKMKAND